MTTLDDQTIKASRQLAESIRSMGGPDLRTLSDAELVERMTKLVGQLAKAARSASISAQEATTAFNKLGMAIQAQQDLHDEQHRQKS